MIINDLSHLEDIPESKLILGAAGGLVIANALVLGNSGYTSIQARVIKKGSTVMGQGISVAFGGYFAQSRVTSAVTSDSEV